MPPAASLLSALLAGALGLQLIAVISTPIVKSIPLGTSGSDLKFGVFGFCQGNTCTSIGVGYNFDPSDSTFDLSQAATRKTLSAILVVHPVAAFFTLILLGCGIASHFHGPSHSSRFLLAFIVLFIPTFILSLLSFLIDVLLFIPHIGWGSWIMLGATIILAVCGILTCAMRRTLVSRKSRKDRVAQNAEMSGQNFYTRQNASTARAASPPPMDHQPTAPMVTGTPGADKLPTFTTFESSRSRTSAEDDRMPLNAGDRTATGMSSTVSGGRPSIDGMERYGGGRGGSMTQGRGGRGYGPPRDQYGNPLPPPNPYGPPGSAGRGSPMGYGPTPYSTETLISGGSSVRGGRGGFPPRGGYQRGGPYGGRGGRGGPPGPMMGGRGGSPPRGGYRGPGGPPPNGQPPGPYGAQYNGSGSSYGGRRPSDPRYAPSPGPPPPAPAPYGAAYANVQQGTSHESFYPRAESPPPLDDDVSPISGGHVPLDAHHEPMQHHAAIGQAIEMDAKTGSPAPPPGTVLPPLRQFSEHDSDVDGMVGLQQNRSGGGQGHGHPISPSSAYSSQRTDSYATANTARPWTGQPGRNGTPPLPNGGEISRPSSARRSPPTVIQTSSTPQPQRARIGSGDNYYEDVDARFAHDEDPAPQHVKVHHNPTSPPPPMTTGLPVPGRPGLEQQKSYDSVVDGPDSDASNFTSISQRPVNPQWAEDSYGGYGYGGVPNRQPPAQQRRDMMLNNNPDFEVPRGPAAGAGRGARM